MVIYAEEHLHPLIRKQRGNKPTEVHSLSQAILEQQPYFEPIQQIRQSAKWQQQADWLSQSPQAQLPHYIPLVMSKFFWLAEAARTRANHEALFWVDCGIHQHLYPGEHGLINEQLFVDLAEKIDKLCLLATPYEKNTEMHGFDREALAQYCQTDYVDRCCKGGLFGGTAAAIRQLAPHYETLLNDTLSNRHMGTEECLLTILSYRHPDLTDTRLLGNHGVPALFSPGIPALSARRLRHPRTTVFNLRRKALRWWYHRTYATQANRILQAPPFTDSAHDEFDLHILLCARDVVNGIWTLRSFLHFSGLRPPIFIHDDGSLTSAHIQTLTHAFPSAHIIGFAQADEQMRKALANCPNSFRYRITEQTWPALKLLDFAHYSAGRPFMVLDADVLFFKEPKEILQAITRHQGFFMSDWQDAYTWPCDRWPAVLNTQGLERVNVGLFYLPASVTYDMDYIEACLGAYYRRQPCPRANWLEQTVWAALFSRNAEHMQRLPDTYQISDKHPITEETISHHFVNDRTLSRLNFSRKGMPFLIEHGFLRDQGSDT